MDQPHVEYVIQVEHPEEGWRELYRSTDAAAARRVWGHLPEIGISARARLLEVALVRLYDPAVAHA